MMFFSISVSSSINACAKTGANASDATASDMGSASMSSGSNAAYNATTSGYINGDKNTITADTQSKGTDADVQLTRQIRQKLTSDDSLSTSAKNIKIITLRDTVTLKGKLKSQEEIDRVVSIAKELAGSKKIRNKIELKK
ncbi:MAG: BON domain-containing protein [Oligoflexia bacterium]|nr:BON domain-containing protein [Oligoflexia bacterium]